MNGTAVLLAVAAALAYAAGAVLQQRGAAPGASRTGPHDDAPLRSIVTRPVWLSGLALDGAGVALELVALRASSLSLVQPLLVSGLLFALPLGALLAHRRISSTEVGTGLLVCAGLTGFLLAARPTAGSGSPTTGRWIAVIAAVGAVVAVLVLLSRGRQRAYRALALGTGAGLVNGVFAGLGKAVATRLDQGWWAVVVSWQLWALAAAAALTLALAARAFQAGAPAAALTGLFASEPIAGLAVGAAVFGDGVRHHPLLVAAAATGLAVALAGATLLTRSPSVLAAYEPGPQPGPAMVPPGAPRRSATAQPSGGTVGLTDPDRDSCPPELEE